MTTRLILSIAFFLISYTLSTAETNASCNFTFSYTGTCPTYSFTPTINLATGVTVTQWDWSFGDGSFSTQQNPTHTYWETGLKIVTATVTTSDNCTSFYQDTINPQCGQIMYLPCVAYFNHQATSCNTVNFSESVYWQDGPPNIWNWNFGDGTNPASGQNVTHTFPGNGTYYVCLTMQTTDYCTNTWCDSIVVNCAPTCTADADFQIDSSACPTIQFTNTSTGSGIDTSWAWSFELQGSSNQENPSFTFGNGSYQVCLTIQTDDGCSDIECKTVTTSCIPSCNSAFQINYGGSCGNYTFTDLSTVNLDTIASWNWDFGDGTTSTQPNPVHYYAQNGLYHISLTITTNSGCTSTFLDAIPITCHSCHAGFDTTRAACNVFTFTDTSITQQNILGWDWDFGDGFTSTQQNPVHTYNFVGTYTAKLRIFTMDNCVDSVMHDITITCVQPCLADFNYTINSCTANFTDNSISGNSTIAYRKWNFGDGNTLYTTSNTTPQHTYTANGNYTICLEITGADSCKNTQCQTISLNCIPFCTAGYLTNTNNCPAIDFFSNSSVSFGTINSWKWYFGDGDSSSLENPSHTYQANGAYNVTLIIGSTSGCADTITSTEQINCIVPPTCTAAFAIDSSNCPTFTFSDLSVASPSGNNIIGRLWKLGDGTVLSDSSFSHTYNYNGVYPIELIITTSSGCKDTSSHTLYVNCYTTSGNGLFTADFGTQHLNCGVIELSDSTGLGGFRYERIWDFGDGTSLVTNDPIDFASTVNLQHIYTTSGTYIVCMTNKYNSGTSFFQLTQCDTVEINCNNLPSYTASFQEDLTNCPTVSFTSTINTTGLTNPNFIWTFGDGATSNLSQTTHTYTANGNYWACLDIYENLNYPQRLTQSCKSIPITCTTNSNLAVGFSKSQLSCGGYVFSDTTSIPQDSVLFRQWNFGDGNMSTTPFPAHTYANNGIYVVTLQLVTTNNSLMTISDTINVNCINITGPTACSARFSYNSNTCGVYNFSSATTFAQPNLINNYFWTFGDGSNSTAANPTYTYAANDSYEVCLTINTAGNCISTVCDTVHITCLPFNNCSSNDSLQIGSLPLNLSVCSSPNGHTLAPSISGNTPMTFQWYFNNQPINFGGNNASYSATLAGSYYLIGSNGCNADTSNTINLSFITTGFYIDANLGTNSCVGDTMILQAISNNNIVNYTYQWYFNGVPISGATSATYQLNNIDYADEGDYTCSLTGPCAGADQTFTLELAKWIDVGNISDTSTCVNNSITITPTGSISTYNFQSPIPQDLHQWFKVGNSTPVFTSAFDSTFTLSPITLNDAGQYFYVNSNSCYIDTSNIFNMAVIDSVQIIAPPQSTTACVGDSVTLSVAATGDSLSYQWLHGGMPISNAINSTLTINGVNSSDAGMYQCIVSNLCESDTSSAATLTINQLAQIDPLPSSIEFCESVGQFILTANIQGTPPISFQWYKNDTIISTATLNFLTLNNLNPSQNGFYHGIATNLCGAVSTDTIELIIHPTPNIQAGADTTILFGGTANLNATGAGSNGSYIWSPSMSLSCDSCQSPMATPTINTEYVVWGYSSFGCPDSDTMTVFVLPVSTQQLLEQTGIEVFPNPSSNFLTVQFKQPLRNNGLLQITDVFGRTIKEQPILHHTSNLTVDVQDLVAATYYLTLQVESQVISLPFIKL